MVVVVVGGRRVVAVVRRPSSVVVLLLVVVLVARVVLVGNVMISFESLRLVGHFRSLRRALVIRGRRNLSDALSSFQAVNIRIP